MKDQFMKMGASDRFFYYVFTGNSTLAPRVTMTFREPFDLSAMKAAADEALGYVPEFNKCIVLSDGKPEAAEGSADVRFLPYEKDKVVYLGSDETNGLLFYFAYTDKKLIFSVYHGLTDAYGFTVYLRTMMYLYAKMKGMVFTPEEEAAFAPLIRTKKGLPENADTDDLFMPYEKHGSADAKPSYIYKNPGAFAITETRYDKNSGYSHLCHIPLSFRALNDLRERAEASMLAVITDIVASSIRDAFKSGDKTVVIMSAVDQRRCLGSASLVNCSDSIFFSYPAELAEKSEKERCAELKAEMKRQLAAENHIKMAGDKVLAVKAFEDDPADAAQIARRLDSIPPTDNFNPMTCISTVTGSLTMGAADRLLEDAEVSMSENACCSILVSWFGDKMHITTANLSDSSDFAEGIVKELEKRGINAGPITEQREYYDIFSYDKIQNKSDESEENL